MCKNGTAHIDMKELEKETKKFDSKNLLFLTRSRIPTITLNRNKERSTITRGMEN
jgi:hypothetical protein